MRSFLLPLAALILALSLTPSLRAAGPNAARVLAEPLHATVVSPGAPVRSGPAESYYLTDTLPEGTAVEIYKRNDDGWCAVRPPEESFSWVFAQNVRLVSDELAEVIKDKSPARVGSRLSSQRDVVEVRMKQGERVTILGQDDRDGGVWYKIAPPAGEFRWMRARDLGMEESSPKSADASGSYVTTTDKRYAVRTVAGEQPIAGEEAAPIAAPPLAPVETITSTTMPAAPAPLPKPNDQWAPAKSQIPTAADVTPLGVAPVASTPAATTPPASSAELAQHLQRLELQLSRMVAEPPGTWNVAPLEQAAEQLLAHAETVQDRNAVKSTLAKIDRFSSIQRRYAAGNAGAMRLPANMPSTSMPSAPTAGTPMIAGTTSLNAAPVAGAQPNSPYDAVGILRPVVSKRPGAPQFALVNAQGQVVTFITPTPDVNLQPFIGQQIGVTGSRGYIPEFRRAHVTAARVAPLNERMIR
ncbi:MAG: SH3 domain-containing protein [Pirellulales bacterium]